jgi:hypothetical protein
MLRRLWHLSFLAALLTATCAHKAPPIAKDRLSPRLSKVAVINTRQVQLTFTEEIDTVALTPNNVLITSTTETLGVLLLYPSLSASEIIIVTQPMKDVTYQIQGRVLDKAENEGLFTSRIQGSTRPDTIAPWVTGYSQGKNKYEFLLDFSEAMDTTRLSFSVVPRKNFVSEWLNHRRVRFLPASPNESLAYDTTYYLYLKTAGDISDNAVKPFITSVTPDTAHTPITLRGKALIENTPADSGLALLARDNIMGIAFVIKGEFAFMVRDSLYFDVVVVSGAYSGKGRAAAAAENIIRLKKEHVDIDTLID